jgi:hypothetical protein
MVEDAFVAGKKERKYHPGATSKRAPLGREREEIISLFIGDIGAAKCGGGIGKKRQEDVDSDVEKRNCFGAPGIRGPRRDFGRGWVTKRKGEIIGGTQ